MNQFLRSADFLDLSLWLKWLSFVFSSVLLIYLFHHKYFPSVSLLSKNYLVIVVHVKTSYPPFQVTIAPIMPMKLSSSSKIKKMIERRTSIIQLSLSFFQRLTICKMPAFYNSGYQVTGLARFMSALRLIQDLEIDEYCIWRSARIEMIVWI